MHNAPDKTRLYWVNTLHRVVHPVFRALARQTLHADLPVETAPDAYDQREDFTHLEAVGRALCGITPWLVCSGLTGEEADRREALLADVA